jgi:iron complex transport system substrate-binding protein
MMTSTPQRIVCLTAETVDLLYRLGAEELIAGVSAFTRYPPEARKKPVVSGFTTIHYDVIEQIKPDLIIAFSDLQADALRELAKRGYPVLLTNQRTIEEMFATLLMIGRIVGKEIEADALVSDLQQRLKHEIETTRHLKRRPRVYFEEWDDPMISGIAWIGELIAAAGGVDVFSELGRLPSAPERIVENEVVVEQSPDIMIASWCGKKVDVDAIRARPDWETIPAVRHNQIHELKAEYCLQPGPSLITEGLPRFAEIIRKWRGTVA